MQARALALVALPKPLRKGIDRRLPRGHFKDLTGQKFGAKSVVGFAGFRGAFAAWLCRCKCGRLCVIRSAFLPKCSSRCHCVPCVSPAGRKLRKLHRSIINRCHEPKDIVYAEYGAVGVTVCKRWRDSLEAFAKDMGPRPSRKHIVVRRNRSGNYTPANCFWGVRADARRGVGRMVKYNGKAQNAAAWARELGITREAMRRRVNRCLELGLDVSEAIADPPKLGRSRKRYLP